MFKAIIVSLYLMLAGSLYDFKVNGLEGGQIDLAKYKGKKILIVNTASQCGYTPQYDDLQKLYDKYKNTLVIVGFPANNFGGQEPGTAAEIQHDKNQPSTNHRIGTSRLLLLSTQHPSLYPRNHKSVSHPQCRLTKIWFGQKTPKK